MMPPQLRYARRPKRSEPRPIAECLPSINDLKIPRLCYSVLAEYWFPIPEISSMRLTYQSIEVTHCTGRRRCSGAIRASQICDRHSRPALQADRIQTFLKFKPLIRRKAR